MRKLLPQGDPVGKRAPLEDKAFTLPLGAVEASVFRGHARHPRGGKQKVVKDFFHTEKTAFYKFFCQKI